MARLIKPEEVCEWLAISNRHLRSLIRSGAIQVIDIGNATRPTYRFSIACVEEFIEARSSIATRIESPRRAGRMRAAPLYEMVDFAALRAARKRRKTPKD